MSKPNWPDGLKCFWCLVDWQSGGRTKVALAEFIYNGQSCCTEHVNTRRGQPLDYGLKRTGAVR